VTNPRRLIVMRHAKAEPFASTDHARALNRRGQAEALAAGEQLRGDGILPDCAFVSSATRTLQTWQAVAAACEVEVPARISDGLYDADPDEVLEALRAAPADAQVVIFIGHNPTAAYVAQLLDDGEGLEPAANGLARGFPPAAFAGFEVSAPWSELAASSGRLVTFFAPSH
jgi:phosphohistidine phosphatase